MRAVLRSFLRSVPRVYPGCIMLAQAVAFNMFLAFFPMLLIEAGVLTSSSVHIAGAFVRVVLITPVLVPLSLQILGEPRVLSRQVTLGGLLLFLGPERLA